MKPSTSNDKNNTPIIVGCVVGGVVGIALIVGVLACINRRGGCTKRRDTKTDFEDYGLGDFPHHRPPVSNGAAAAVDAGAGIGSASSMANTKHVSPTIPRLNDQGNYYPDDGGYAIGTGRGPHYNSGYMDADYGIAPAQQQYQGGYYYPTQQQQEYYGDGGYYYDNNTSTAYSSVPPMQQHSPAMHNVMPHQQQGYAMTSPLYHQQPQDIHKPDEIGSAIPIVSNEEGVSRIR
ncbi:hypothetical protein BDF20DRAFT_497122 [Mycotypha africana]|uniref:uncharacterized protein n=1 Tax=Mycotypha africana TaxID=64632 RepID=UPI002300F39D|nr:uncharacterized protein BDF20DRAFT_497122 [Mycotypha africana]KAI8979328.1 hypothetical protein BDF20DRAFT_497122 [Mycotypha africana]